VLLGIWIVTNAEKLGGAISNKRTKIAINFTVITVIVVGILVALYVIFNQFDNLYVDLTLDKRYQLDVQTYNVLGELEKGETPQKIVIYVADMAEDKSMYQVLLRRASEENNQMAMQNYWERMNYAREVKNTLKNYEDNGNVEVHYLGQVNPQTLKMRGFSAFTNNDYGSLAIEIHDFDWEETLSENLFEESAPDTTERQIIKLDDMVEKTPVPNQFGNSVNWQFKGFKIEEQVTKAIKQLLKIESKQGIPKVYFVSGHGEVDLNRGLRNIRQALSKSFSVSTYEMPFTGLDQSDRDADLMKDLGLIEEEDTESTNLSGEESPEESESIAETDESVVDQSANDITLDSGVSNEPEDITIPEDCDVLIMVEPRQPLPPAHIKAIKDYLALGKQFVLLKSSSVDFMPIFNQISIDGNGAAVIDSLNRILGDYGVQLENGWIKQKVEGLEEYHPQFKAIYRQHDITKPLLATSDYEMLFIDATAIEKMESKPDGVTITDLLATSSQAQMVKIPASNQQAVLQQAFENPESGTYTLGTLITKDLGSSSPEPDAESDESDSNSDKKQASILLISDASVVLDQILESQQVQVAQHKDFFKNALAYLNNLKSEISIESRKFNTPYIHINFYDIVGFFTVAVLFVILALGILGFTFVWLRNRRKASLETKLP